MYYNCIVASIAEPCVSIVIAANPGMAVVIH